jgi:DNA-binding NarL/FixJ family response regulator
VAGARVLVAEDRVGPAILLTEVLATAGFHAAPVAHELIVTRVVAAEDVAVVVASFSGRGVGATASLLRELRSRPEPGVRHVGVVAILDDESDAAFGIGSDADAVLLRPVDAERLVDAVTEVAASGDRRRPAVSR